MPLTPADVSSKRFTPVRLREGYDMSEVDQFLDEVEAELQRLLAENEDLRRSTGSANGSTTSVDVGTQPATGQKTKDSTPKADSGKDASPDKHRPVDTEAPGKVEEPREATAPHTVNSTPGAAVQTPAAAPQGERLPAREAIKVTTAAEASAAATRLLERAIQNADETEAEAEAQAQKILTEAKTKAERLESEAKTRTDKLEQDSRSRVQALDTEATSKRQQLLGGMEKEKTKLGAEIENLRSFEREYRSRLKTYFSEQLAALEDPARAGGEPSDGPGATGGRRAPGS